MKSVIDIIKKAISMVPQPVFIFVFHLTKHDLATFSACTAYYLVLSAVPLIITMLAILPFTPIDEETLITIITTITPQFATDFVITFIDAAYTQSVSLLSGSIIIALWSASKGMLGLMNGLNEITQSSEKNRNGISVRIWAFMYTLAMLAVFFAMLILLVFGDQIFILIEKAIPQLSIVWDSIMKYRLVFIFIPAIILIAFMYTFVPRKKLRFRDQLAGAFFCSLGWAGLSMGFSMYITLFGGSSLYGSLATPMFLIIWLYACVYVIFLGAIINLSLTEWKSSGER